jgi:LacI family transcriptional regulator
MPAERRASRPAPLSDPLGRRVTLADVAARADVSRATASRALAGDARISAGTRVRVEAAARELDYVPDLTARSLRARRTNALGLLLPDLSDPVHGQVAAAFEVAAAAAGYSVIIVAAHGDAAAERRALTIFIERGVDGICVASSRVDPQEVQERVGRIPLTFVQPDRGSVVDPAVLPPLTIRTDDASGIDQAVRHLLATGRQEIAYLGVGEGATNRWRGEVAASTLVAAADRPMTAFQVADDAWMRPGELAASLPIPALPEGIVCYDDKTALALLDGLRTRGIRVPDDVAIVGFDDIPFAALSSPRLTTVWTPTQQMGGHAARSLVAAVASGTVPTSRLLPVRLVVRESSGWTGAPALRERPLVGTSVSADA